MEYRRRGITPDPKGGTMPPALDRPLPAWLAGAPRGAVCRVAGLPLPGMPLAMARASRPAAAVPLALLAGAGLLWLVRPAAGAGVARGAAGGRAVVLPAIGAVA